MNEVDRVYEELIGIEAVVVASNDLSAVASYNQHSAKILLLAAASYFERRSTSIIEAFIDASVTHDALRRFTINQAVERKFFSLFDFSSDAKNINSFLSKFGPNFLTAAKNDMRRRELSADSQNAFLTLCRLRNSLMHNNYATFPVNQTLREVKKLFDDALLLLVWMEEFFQAARGQDGVEVSE